MTAKERIVDALREHGPMTAAELVRAVDRKKATVTEALRDLMAEEPRRIYIDDYLRLPVSEHSKSMRGGSANRVFARVPEDGKWRDARPPKADRNAAAKRYREKMRGLIRLRDNLKKRGTRVSPFAALLGVSNVR